MHAKKPDFDGRPGLNAAARSFVEAMLEGDIDAAARILRKAAFTGDTVESIDLRIVQPSVLEVGRLTELGRLTVVRRGLFGTGVTLLLNDLALWGALRPSDEARQQSARDGALPRSGVVSLLRFRKRSDVLADLRERRE